MYSAKPHPANIGVLIHEQYHVNRNKNSGSVFNMLKIGVRYWLDPKFRLQEEFNANKAQFKYLKEHNTPFDIEARAKSLSGVYYLFCVSEKEALRKLKELWNNI